MVPRTKSSTYELLPHRTSDSTFSFVDWVITKATRLGVSMIIETRAAAHPVAGTRRRAELLPALVEELFAQRLAHCLCAARITSSQSRSPMSPKRMNSPLVGHNFVSVPRPGHRQRARIASSRVRDHARRPKRSAARTGRPGSWARDRPRRSSCAQLVRVYRLSAPAEIRVLCVLAQCDHN